MGDEPDTKTPTRDMNRFRELDMWRLPRMLQLRVSRVSILSVPGVLRSIALFELLRYSDVAQLSAREGVPGFLSNGEPVIEIV
jgi:hypothetical protein